ncbi:MAG: RNA polymerase sigma factor FliA [Phycisphaerae bacterium]|nr:RNA polymerase sigma factor FliA [Phycisphaerae bacterium]
MALTFTEDVNKLWKRYARQPSLELRNKLMEMYLPLVKFNADRVATKLPSEVDVDDLISAGIFGLMDAIDSFDLQRGVKFETYCAPRIRGAILDELRSMDWVPRLVRSRASRLEGARRGLEAELGRSPTEKELAQRLGLSVSDFEKLRDDASAVSMVSLSRKYYETDSNRDVCEIDIIEDDESLDPEQEAVKSDLRSFVSQNLTRLEQLILVLYYYEEMTMKEIGQTLDLSESRVSQMHSAIMSSLQTRLRELPITTAYPAC